MSDMQVTVKLSAKRLARLLSLEEQPDTEMQLRLLDSLGLKMLMASELGIPNSWDVRSSVIFEAFLEKIGKEAA